MEWTLSIPCWVLSVVAFFLVPVRTFGYSSTKGYSRLLSSYPNDSSNIETRSQITISLLKSRKHWLKKDIWRLENKISARNPISEDSAEGYYYNSEIKRSYNTRIDSLNTESCWLGISCEEFSTVAPPHDVINLVPPPPLPLFLFQLELFPDRSGLEEYLYLMDQFDFQSYYLIEKKNDGGREEKVFRVNPAWLSYDVAYGCSLCDWAKSNFTDSLFAEHTPYEGTERASKWIEMLVIVGFVSGLFGAVFACCLTRFKFWFRIFGEKDGKKESTIPDYTLSTDIAFNSEPMVGRSLTTGDAIQTKTATFDQNDSQECPNTDSEDTYINASSVNLRFSQLVSKYEGIESDSVLYYDPMSLCNEHCCRNDINSITKENHQVSPSDVSSDLTTSTLSPVASPLITSSAPSSAYYSDLSVFELPSYRKKKKKRKGDLERNLRKEVYELSDTYSPALTNHLLSNKQSLTSSKEFGVPFSKVNENFHQNFSGRNIPSNSLHSKGKCLHNSPNFIQNRTKVAASVDMPQTVQSAIVASPIHNTCQVMPKFIHLTPECARYIPNVAFKTTNLNSSIFRLPYIVDEETVPALIKHFDKDSEIEYINNNITTDNTTKLANSPKFTETIAKDCYCVLSSQNSTGLGVENSNFLSEKNLSIGHIPNYFNPFTDIYREQDIYRVYSSSEVPSEYI